MILYVGGGVLYEHIGDWLRDRGEQVQFHGNQSIADVEWSQIDLGLSVKYRRIVPAEVLAHTPFLNLHNSYLPWCRGAHTSFWPLVEGCPAGVTIHWMTAGLDQGPIIAQQLVPMTWWDTEDSLYKKLDMKAFRLFTECWERYAPDRWPPGTPQPAGGSYHSVKDYEDRQL